MDGEPSRPITHHWLATHLSSRDELAHRGDFGRVLVIAGCLDYPGAAVLAGLGALRAGAGSVRVAVSESVHARMAGSVPELTWMVLDEEAPGLIAPGGWRRLAAEATSYDAAVVGPGLGQQPATLRRTRSLLAGLGMPSVIDADGLNALAREPDWWTHLPRSFVLTPHPGEFARLTGAPAPAAADDIGRADAASEASRRWGQVVVLKGARSVVALPDGSSLVSAVATPALATAGSGDVLAGAIGALLAAGLTVGDAAACGVGLHAAAGELAQERVGMAGTIAGDIARLLPDARRRIAAGALE